MNLTVMDLAEGTFKTGTWNEGAAFWCQYDRTVTAIQGEATSSNMESGLHHQASGKNIAIFQLIALSIFILVGHCYLYVIVYLLFLYCGFGLPDLRC